MPLRCRYGVVPAGFVWDGPTCFLALDAVMRASCVHDWLYETRPPGVSQREADDLFLAMLREDGAGWLAAVTATPLLRAVFTVWWRT